ncbi:MAG: FAD-binding oxidoreductase [Pseudomonadota bacterium]
MSDAVIIGGGIAGTSLGARLAPHMTVTLLEAEDFLGTQASGRSAALFEETYGLPSTVALNEASKEDHMTLDGGVLSPRGLLLLDSGDPEDFDRDMVQMKMEEITVEDACAKVPILDPQSIRRAGYHAEAWDIDTDRLIQHFARTIRSHGGTVVNGAKATAIACAQGRWQVITPKGHFEAPLLCNAAGAWVDQIATLAGVAPLGFTPLRRSMARLAAPGGHDLRDWPMMFGPGETWYAKPDAGALLVSPAEEVPSEPMDAWAPDEAIAEGLELYSAHVTAPITRPLATWAGLRTFSPDRNLVIGFDPGDPSFFWQAGQGGYGFQTSPAASRYGADVILGRPSELDAQTRAALDPARFAAVRA